MTFNYEFRDFGTIKNILYVGDDSNYWSQIKKEYEKHFSAISCLFYIYRIEGDITYKDVFLKILQLKPSIVYLDFTKKHNEMFHLSRLLSRDGQFFGSSVVGLVNHVEEVDEAMKNGCNFVYVKCGEFFDSVYGPLRFSLPNIIPAPNFAKGMLDEQRDVYIPLRVGHIQPNIITFEGNFTPQQNTDYEIETHIGRNFLPSKRFKSALVLQDAGAYYNNCSVFSMEYYYVNKPSLLIEIEKAKKLNQKLDASPQVINAAIAEYNAERKMVRQNFVKWINSALKDSKQKRTRILLIDQEYEVLHQYMGDLSETPYAFRMQSEVDYAKLDFEYFRPDLVVFNLINEPDLDQARKIIFDHRKKKGTANKYQKKNIYDSTEADPLDEKDDLDIEIADNADEDDLKKELAEKIINDQLKRFFSSVKQIKNYNPSVLVFNCKKSTDDLISTYGYEKVISTIGKFDFNLINKMSSLIDGNLKKKELQRIEIKLDKLKKDNPIKYKGIRPQDVVEPKFYVPKNDKNSTARVKVGVKLLAISESEIWFTSKERLNFGVYEMDVPTKVRFTIAPDPETFQHFSADKEGEIYHGLIHSFDENGKKALRQDVNRIFFSDLIAQREMESQEYQEITKEALNKKMEELEKLKKMMELNEVRKKI